ncbi:glycosyltransferase [Apibacter raozihei]|uniref:glycosyltransferase family 2 protein n=1 Tax=Apibacter raozihei TaxID=2500547 RepID=UPI000FE3D842|nr:glycosyltransferase [Apibacter raozihei]
MKKDPLISVIIVCYNHSDYIEECLGSLLNQTYSNWELIIADDFSKDNSTHVIENWLNQHNVKAEKIFHTKNIGLCNTLNECIKLSVGEYIKIIAADDFMDPNLFLKLLNKFKELPEEYKLVYSNASFIDEKGNIGGNLLFKNFGFDKNRIRDILFQNNIVIALTTLVKKEVYEKIGTYNTEYFVEDYEFLLRYSKYYKFDYVDEVLGYYRQHANNLSKNEKMDTEIVRIKIYNDKNGDYAQIISKNMVELYRRNYVDSTLIKEYKNYKGKKNILYYFMKFKVPYQIYNLKNKILYRKSL